MHIFKGGCKFHAFLLLYYDFIWLKAHADKIWVNVMMDAQLILIPMKFR